MDCEVKSALDYIKTGQVLSLHKHSTKAAFIGENKPQTLFQMF